MIINTAQAPLRGTAVVGTITLIMTDVDGKKAVLKTHGGLLMSGASCSMISIRNLYTDGHKTTMSEHSGHLRLANGQVIKLDLDGDGGWILPYDCTDKKGKPIIPKKHLVECRDKTYFGRVGTRTRSQRIGETKLTNPPTEGVTHHRSLNLSQPPLGPNHQESILSPLRPVHQKWGAAQSPRNSLLSPLSRNL